MQVATEREIDLVRMKNVQFPEKECRLICTEKSYERTRATVGTSACVVPKMRGWLTSKCRYLHGLESMSLQGIHFPSSEQ